MQEFILAIKSKKNTQSIEELERIAVEFPYFHLAKSLLLKKYHQQEHFKYNNTLKNVAAHSHNREVLFDFINKIEETKAEIKTPTKTPIAKISNQNNITPLSSVKKEGIIEDNVIDNKPFKFDHFEKHSFHQWLQLKNPEPIHREDHLNKQKPSNSKLNIINQFIQNNPKISPIKKSGPISNPVFKSPSTDISNELMTETLAKVYLAQKKYDNAVQAYKILILKYPEKSSLFADQIQRIKILQTNK